MVHSGIFVQNVPGAVRISGLRIVGSPTHRPSSYIDCVDGVAAWNMYFARRKYPESGYDGY